MSYRDITIQAIKKALFEATIDVKARIEEHDKFTGMKVPCNQLYYLESKIKTAQRLMKEDEETKSKVQDPSTERRDQQV